MSIRCRLGVHQWQAWTSTDAVQQRRVCARCQLAERRAQWGKKTLLQITERAGSVSITFERSDREGYDAEFSWFLQEFARRGYRPLVTDIYPLLGVGWHPVWAERCELIVPQAVYTAVQRLKAEAGA